MTSTARLSKLSFGVVTGWILTFLVLPIGAMIGQHVDFSEIFTVLSNSSTRRVLWFSTWQAALSAILTLIVAAPVTWLIARHEFRGRRLLRAVTTVGFLLPSVVVATAFLAVLPTRLHFTMIAVIAAHVYFNIAVVVRIVGARLELFDARLSNAARTLGASPTKTLLTIAWPIVRNAVASSMAVIFLYCFTSLAIVRVLGGVTRSTIEADIALRAFGIGDLSSATILSVLQTIFIVLVVAIIRSIGGKHHTFARAANTQPPRLAHRHRPLAVVVAVGTSLFVFAPLTALFWRSLHVGDSFSFAAWQSIVRGQTLAALVASVRVAITTGVIGVMLALMAAFVIVRSVQLGRILDFLTLIPLAVSPVTLGLGLVITFDVGWIDWRASWWLIVAAHTLVAFPLAVRVLVPAWRTIPSGLRAAAGVLGASEHRQLRNVDLRLMRRPVGAALGLIVAVSLGEFGAASLLSRSGSETLPVLIARLLGRTGDVIRAQAFALASVLVVACLSALFLVEIALGRSRRASRF